MLRMDADSSQTLCLSPSGARDSTRSLNANGIPPIQEQSPHPAAPSTLGYRTSSSSPLCIVKKGTDCAEGTCLVRSPEPGQYSADPDNLLHSSQGEWKGFYDLLTTKSVMGKSLGGQTLAKQETHTLHGCTLKNKMKSLWL